jgi:hypothetical protein
LGLPRWQTAPQATLAGLKPYETNKVGLAALGL